MLGLGMDGNLLPYHQREDGQRYFTNADMARMVEQGLIDPDDRWELIRGEWFDMPSEGYAHMDVRGALSQLFSAKLGYPSPSRVNSEGSIFLSEDTELRPDLVIYRADVGTNQMTGRDIFLVAEIMSSSHHRDRMLKLPVYAEAGVPELWLIDLDAGEITVLREPDARGYSSERVVDAGTEISPLAFPDISLSLSMLKTR
jgi:Uma2 family endonuclease